MTYSVPGPGREEDFFRLRRKDETSAVSQARQASEELFGAPPRENTGSVGSRPARPVETKTTAGPPVLDRLLRHEEARAAARAADDLRLADRALGEVVQDLDELLNYAATHLHQAGRGRSRQRVQEAVPQLAAMAGVAALPLGEVAEFLDLPRARVDEVLGTLARYGGITPAERHEALQQVEWLREQLGHVAATKNHSLLDRILAFVSKFAVFAVVTLTSAAAGAFAVGESALTEVVKAGVVALVAAALQLAAVHALDQPGRRDPHTAAREAHTALLADLAEAHVLWEEPAYDAEHAVVRIRLGVRCCAARITSLVLAWQDKQRYWELLDQLTEALAVDSRTEVTVLTRRIAALSPPANPSR
ncbi:hypothetical protein ACWGPQ_04160 [Saccharomonospora azurea]|uniref:hypothetical protein n=1 Tax=Saccharomonospora azurea TaxID=40988 RepID=UPI0033221B21